MGKEAASACARWFMLKDFNVKLELTAVCDLEISVLDWYRQIPTVTLLTQHYADLLASDNVDIVYVAVPHHLHERIYIDTLHAGKDLLAEKPFGIDLHAALNIASAVKTSGRFVRCSSEFPFLPGPQEVVNFYTNNKLGEVLQISSGFWHSSDMDPTKPINWKRQTKFCGQIGVMGDLGMHALHLPLRLGLKPQKVFAQLQKIYSERPDGKGGMAACDTWDNAILSTSVQLAGKQVPMRIETKRMVPGETNTWFIEMLGTEGGIRYSTKTPKTLHVYDRAQGQAWLQTDLGFNVPYPVATGGIFEVGFPDCFMQMLAAYIAEREGIYDGKFRCATVDEAIATQALFAAALESHTSGNVTQVQYRIK